ncbi:MAG: poly(R)-hydroxyalkanoic acid synthase subunit PhaE [Steroidobacteraceae bacterium]
MESADPGGGPEREQPAFAAELERFGRLLQAIGGEFAPATAGSPDSQGLVRRLAAEFDSWLQNPAAMPQWWQNLQTVPPFAPQLTAQWSRLQAQLALQWSAVARGAGERFITRVTAIPAAPDLKDIRALYDSWIDCAEEAYAARVHTDEFCTIQAELINTAIELVLEQRRQVENVARMCGMPTRSEVDALRLQMRQMQDAPSCAIRGSRTKARRRKRRVR